LEIRLSPLHYQVTEEKLERSRLARAAAAVNHVPRLELGVSELAGMIIYLCYILGVRLETLYSDFIDLISVTTWILPMCLGLFTLEFQLGFE
ncbi:hypothetical protein LINGRAHAP2_LOCUS4837, partial [Linum grandiflorum]